MDRRVGRAKAKPTLRPAGVVLADFASLYPPYSPPLRAKKALGDCPKVFLNIEENADWLA